MIFLQRTELTIAGLVFAGVLNENNYGHWFRKDFGN